MFFTVTHTFLCGLHLKFCYRMTLHIFYFQPLYTMTKKTRFSIFSPNREKARNIDRLSRLIFPTVFIIFNIVYWLVYIFWEPDKSEV